MQGPSQPLTQSPSAATPVRSAILTPANLPPDDIDWISNASFTFELLAGAGELDRTGIAKAIANIALPILKLAQNNKKARDELRDTINYLDEMLSYVSEEVELLQYGQSLTDASTRPLARLQQMGDEFVSQLKVLKDDLNMIYGETGFHAKMKKPFQSKAILDRVNQHKGYVKEARDRLVTTAVLSATRQIERIVEHLMGPSKMTQPVNYLPPRALPPIPAPRSPSPFTVAGKKQSALTPALGILGALNPHSLDGTAHNNNDSLVSDHGHSNRKDHFWAKDKHHESLRDDDLPTVTKMIGLFTATASENWDIVLEICECSSASDTNAKEAVRALRREFKYGEPSAQLSAARLWAIMLRNSTDTFISQSTSKKFLDTLEDVITSPRTSPVVRERVMDVVAAAAYASGTRKDTGFRALWRKVKSPEKPDEGIPFDTDDAMFSPPVNNRLSHYENPVSAQDPVPRTTHNHRKRKSPTRNRIIPPEEDIKRLFQECKIGQGNASLLSQALALARPEDLREKDVIQEFYLKCRQSQEIIYAQIPWATAGAERSRAEQQRKRTLSDNSLLDDAPVPLTTEEQLLAALLGANEEIADALQQYDDLERVGLEREAEENSRRDVRMDPKQKQLLEQQELLSAMADVHIGGSSSRSPSPAHSSRSRPVSLLHSDVSAAQTLAPPPAPHGPRSPTQTSVHSRTSSPNVELTIATLANGSDSYSSSSDDSVETPVKPSAKALGKRRVIEAEEADNPFDPDDLFYENRDEFPVEDRNDSDSDDSRDVRWHNAHPVHFVYDAAAERTRQRLEKGHALVVNGVH